MAPFSCKKCGGLLRLEPGKTEGVCVSCGARQPLQEQNDDEAARKNEIYRDATSMAARATVESNEAAIRLFESILDWKDSRARIERCRQKIAELTRAEEQAEEEHRREDEERQIAADERRNRVIRIVKIVVPVAAVCCVLAIVLIKAITLNSNYKKAADLYNAGKYEEAISAFEALGDYKDSNSRVRDCQSKLMDTVLQEQNDELKNAAVGATVRFGFYEQDDNTANGKEEIEWKVLAVREDHALLISKYALDCQPYNTISSDVTWATCSLRKWLNNEFLNAAFSAVQQARIGTATVTEDAAEIVTEEESESVTEEVTQEEETEDEAMSVEDLPVYITDDQVFLLSLAEVKAYFRTDADRKCAPTDYATAQGAWASDRSVVGGKATGWWWLRSPGDSAYTAAVVISDGTVLESGANVYRGSNSIRPAIWISLDG